MIMHRVLLVATLVFGAACARAEDVAIVVSGECKVTELSLTDARLILRCEKVRASGSAKWFVYLRPDSAPEHAAMLKHVLKCDAATLKAYFLQAVFNGSIQDAPKEVGPTALLLHLVRDNPTAISYLPAKDVSLGVKQLKIDGLLPGQQGYPIKTD